MINSDIISSLGDSLDVLKMKNTKTFQNFDFSELSGKGLEKLKSITPNEKIIKVKLKGQPSLQFRN